MGNTAGMISTTDSPRAPRKYSLGIKSLLSHASSKEGDENDDQQTILKDEINQMRSQLKTNNTLLFPNPTVFIFFAPPEYPTVNAANFLSTYVNLPVIYPTEYIVDKQGRQYQHSQLTPLGEGGGWDGGGGGSTRRALVSGTTGPSPISPSNRSPTSRSLRQSQHQQQGQQHQQPLEILNVSTQRILRRSSSIQENPTRANLLRRIQQDDCERGFILYEYPDTITEMKHFKQVIAPHAKVEIIHLKLDNETMRNLMHKFDRWVHEPSGRSYHLCSNPPKSFTNSCYHPCAENMVDDETGEPLQKLSQDTVQHYKEQLHLYDLKEIPMFYEFEDSSHIVTGGTTEKAVHTSILQTVYNIRVNEIKAKHLTSTAESLMKPTNAGTTTAAAATNS